MPGREKTIDLVNILVYILVYIYNIYEHIFVWYINIYVDKCIDLLLSLLSCENIWFLGKTDWLRYEGRQLLLKFGPKVAKTSACGQLEWAAKYTYVYVCICIIFVKVVESMLVCVFMSTCQCGSYILSTTLGSAVANEINQYVDVRRKGTHKYIHIHTQKAQ